MWLELYSLTISNTSSNTFPTMFMFFIIYIPAPSYALPFSSNFIPNSWFSLHIKHELHHTSSSSHKRNKRFVFLNMGTIASLQLSSFQPFHFHPVNITGCFCERKSMNEAGCISYWLSLCICLLVVLSYRTSYTKLVQPLIFLFKEGLYYK